MNAHYIIKRETDKHLQQQAREHAVRRREYAAWVLEQINGPKAKEMQGEI